MTKFIEIVGSSRILINPLFIVSLEQMGELVKVATMDGKVYMSSESMDKIVSKIKRSESFTISNA